MGLCINSLLRLRPSHVTRGEIREENNTTPSAWQINGFGREQSVDGAYFESTASTTAALHMPKRSSTGHPMLFGLWSGLGFLSGLALLPSRPPPITLRIGTRHFLRSFEFGPGFISYARDGLGCALMW